jgi:hypothetical protein
MTFAAPVAIAANTAYIASYHTSAGHTSDDSNYFASTGVSNGPLQAVQNSVSQPNGVFALSATSTFPTNSSLSDNYWVDVAFLPPVTLRLSPTAIVGGSTVVGTITLPVPAPAGGTVVTLVSGNTGVATVPASATILAGATTATFTAATSVQSISTQVTISGTSSGGSGSALLTVISALSGLAGYWTFDDGFGDVAADSSGNGYTALLVNGPVFVAGKIGNAVSANGINQYVSTPAINLSATNAVTVAMWVNRTYSTAGDVLFENSSNYNSSTTGFGFFPDDATCGGMQAGVHGNVGYSVNCYSQPTSGAWHHIAIVYDKSQTTGSNVVSLYIDGVLQTPTKNLNTSTNTNNFGSNPIYMFSRGGTSNFSAGELDDVQVYDRALLASEIQEIYNVGNAPPPLTLALSPTSVVGGGTSTGTVTLGTAAPSGGAVVALSSNNNSVATVPPTVTVEQGSATAVFTVTTSGVVSAVEVGITGTYGVAQTANLDVTPAVSGNPSRFIQWASCDSGAVTTSTCYQDTSATSGNLILVFSHWDNVAVTASVTDSLGNSYFPIGGPATSGTSRFQVWYAKNIAGGAPLAVTVTFSAKTTSYSLVDVAEYSGLDTNAPLDTFASATGTGMFQDSGASPLTTENTESIIGFFGYNEPSNPYTAGSGFTFRNSDATSMLEDEPVTSAGTYHATASSSASANWAAFVIAFRTATSAADVFNRANAPTLGTNWTPLVGNSNNVALGIVNNQVVSTAANPYIAKEMYYGGLNWTPDQFSQSQIIAATGDGYEGPAVRMTSNDTYYACVVYNTGSGNSQVAILRDLAGTTSALVTSAAATVAAGDLVRCGVQGTNLTMTDQTRSTTLLTATDASILSGYPGLVDSVGTASATSYVMANWGGGANAASLSAQQMASDAFNRVDALSLGPNWTVGPGHGPIQIVSQQVQPYPAGGIQPSKEHYTAAGAFPNDMWSEIQVITADTLGDLAVELRASNTADNMYICDVNIAGPTGMAETRIAMVLNGVITALAVDQQWSAVSPGDYVLGQVRGNLISFIDVTTGVLLLSAADSTLTAGYAGISLQAIDGNPSDHIAANWSGGGFQ